MGNACAGAGAARLGALPVTSARGVRTMPLQSAQRCPHGCRGSRKSVWWQTFAGGTGLAVASRVVAARPTIPQTGSRSGEVTTPGPIWSRLAMALLSLKASLEESTASTLPPVTDDGQKGNGKRPHNEAEEAETDADSE